MAESSFQEWIYWKVEPALSQAYRFKLEHWLGVIYFIYPSHYSFQTCDNSQPSA